MSARSRSTSSASASTPSTTCASLPARSSPTARRAHRRTASCRAARCPPRSSRCSGGDCAPRTSARSATTRRRRSAHRCARPASTARRRAARASGSHTSVILVDARHRRAHRCTGSGRQRSRCAPTSSIRSRRRPRAAARRRRRRTALLAAAVARDAGAVAVMLDVDGPVPAPRRCWHAPTPPPVTDGYFHRAPHRPRRSRRTALRRMCLEGPVASPSRRSAPVRRPGVRIAASLHAVAGLRRAGRRYHQRRRLCFPRRRALRIAALAESALRALRFATAAAGARTARLGGRSSVPSLAMRSSSRRIDQTPDPARQRGQCDCLPPS